MIDKEVFGPLEGQYAREPGSNREKEPKETSNVSQEREKVVYTTRGQYGVQTHLVVKLESRREVVDASFCAVIALHMEVGALSFGKAGYRHN